MKPRTFQYLVIPIPGGGRGNGGTRIKIWPCKYVGCKRVLNDLDNHLTTKYCKFHKEIRVKEKNHNCYVKRRGETKPNKLSLIIHLLKQSKLASSYQLMAYSGVKNIHILRSDICYLNRRGHKIIHNRKEGFYYLEK